jgi:hypothetical protein
LSFNNVEKGETDHELQTYVRPPYCPYEDNKIIELCNKLWLENNSEKLAKEKKYIPAILELNQWIKRNLEDLVKELKEKENFLKCSFLSYTHF